MTKKRLIAVDDGHGSITAGKRTPYIPSLGRHIKENEFNKPVTDLVEAGLKRCGFDVIQLAPTDEDTPLAERTKKANDANADLLLSFHFNAMGYTFSYSSASGFSVHIQPADKAWAQSGSLKIAKLLIEELAKGTKQVNRNIVGQNLHMTRESNMPAALVEFGFMDDEREALLMLSHAFHVECSEEVIRAVCRYFDQPYIAPKTTKPVATPKPAEKEDSYYRVRKSWADEASQLGAFHAPGGAKALADTRKHDGYKVYDPSGKLYYTPNTVVTLRVPSVTLKYGDEGNQVKLLQKCLNAANFKLKKSVDGKFGPDVLQALKRFQSVHANPADGIAGPKTRAALKKVLKL